MPIVVVDKDGKPLPASGLVFGDGYRVENLGNGIVRIEVSGSIEVTKVVTAEKGVTRWLTTTRQISAERVTDVTVTQFVTRDKESTHIRYIGTLTDLKLLTPIRDFTTTRGPIEQTHEKYEETVTRDLSMTDDVTHDKYQATISKDATVTKERTVTKYHSLTIWYLEG